jgi:hypothetical protein
VSLCRIVRRNLLKEPAAPAQEGAPAIVANVATTYLMHLERLERSAHYLTDSQANLWNWIIPTLGKRDIGTHRSCTAGLRCNRRQQRAQGDR